MSCFTVYIYLNKYVVRISALYQLEEPV